jgi:hypothetical protein
LDEFIGPLIAFTLIAAIASVITAILLRAGAKWVARIDVSFANAYGAAFIASMLGIGTGALIALVTRATLSALPNPNLAFTLTRLALIPAGFLVQAGIVTWRFKVRFVQACLITLVAIALDIAISAIVGLFIFALIAIVNAF